MQIKKYPIISRNNKSYIVRIKRSSSDLGKDLLTCCLYKKVLGLPFKVYNETVTYTIIKDLKLLVNSVVESYEYREGYGKVVHHNLDKFLEWGGDLRIKEDLSK